MRLLIALLLTSVMLACGDGEYPGKSPFGSVNQSQSGGSDGGASAGGSGGTGLFSRTGTGDDVFTLPATVNIIRVSGTYSGESQNFVVYANGDLVVNEIIGTTRTPATHEGVYVVNPGATVEIKGSSGVEWKVVSESSQSTASGAAFQKSGSGDTVFDLPARAATYRIQASYGGTSSNFVVHVGGQLVVNELLGTTWSASEFAGTYPLPASGRVEITRSSGVAWSFTEQR
jgi:hypothetical protein